MEYNKRKCLFPAKITYYMVLREAEKKLKESGVPDAGVDAWLLLEYLTRETRASFLLKAEEEFPEKLYENYNRLISLRMTRMPLQYITGTQEFMGFAFSVNEYVLIPRQDTEVLTEAAGSRCKDKKILELCTGSGCIAICLNLLFGARDVTAVDISEGALKVARKNGQELAAEITWLQGDLFSPVEGNYDMIVSNPPYIEHGIIDTLMPEVKEFEPRLALDGDVDGLLFYRRIIQEAPAYLNKGGYVFLEIGSCQAADVFKLLLEQGFSEIEVKKDYAGLDRVVSARW